MIDIHSHLLYGVDDGAKTIEDSLQLAKELEKLGFTAVCATSHYLKQGYGEDQEVYQNHLKELRSKMEKLGLALKIYEGNEVYISEEMAEQIKKKKVNTLNHTRYLLMELPMNFPKENAEDILYALKEAGIIPIIAHPERYRYVQQDPNVVLDWIQLGALLQLNYGSLIGKHGKEALKTAKTLVKHHMIQFVATDSHTDLELYQEVKKAKKVLKKLIDKEMLEELTLKNQEAILQDREIEIYEPIACE